MAVQSGNRSGVGSEAYLNGVVNSANGGPDLLDGQIRIRKTRDNY